MRKYFIAAIEGSLVFVWLAAAGVGFLWLAIAVISLMGDL